MSAVEVEPEASELLSRLERQAEESGRLDGRVKTLEGALRSERDARRRVTTALTRERKAAEAIQARAEQAEAAQAGQAAEFEGLRQAKVLAEQQVQIIWRKLLRRPPAQ
ncbi:MAG TPA: hypothetical protein VF056_13050 [Thermoleophilaceae bacterium]